MRHISISDIINIRGSVNDCAKYFKMKAVRTATCDKAGSPNDVCPYGQVMSASPNDVAYGYDVVPAAQWANITYIPSENKISYNTLYLASKIVCKRDEKISSLLCFDIKLLYGRCPNGLLFFNARREKSRSSVCKQEDFDHLPVLISKELCGFCG